MRMWPSMTPRASPEYLLQEARGTMKALQAERDVAQRIAEHVRQLHGRTGEQQVSA